jgi:hypothetical protein
MSFRDIANPVLGEGTAAKDDAIRGWCERVAQATAAPWRFIRINQPEFLASAATLRELVDSGDSPF